MHYYLEFTITNMLPVLPSVRVYVYFDDRAKYLNFNFRFKKMLSCKKFSLFNVDEITDDFDADLKAIKDKGIPESAEFTVRFISDFPVVISNKNKKDTYHA